MKEKSLTEKIGLYLSSMIIFNIIYLIRLNDFSEPPEILKIVNTFVFVFLVLGFAKTFSVISELKRKQIQKNSIKQNAGRYYLITLIIITDALVMPTGNSYTTLIVYILFMYTAGAIYIKQSYFEYNPTLLILEQERE